MKGKIGLVIGVFLAVCLIGGILLLAGIVTGYGTTNNASKVSVSPMHGEKVLGTAVPAVAENPDACSMGHSCGSSCEKPATTKGATKVSVSNDEKSACPMAAGHSGCGTCESAFPIKGSGTTKASAAKDGKQVCPVCGKAGEICTEKEKAKSNSKK